jgi:hypothetical protein
MSSDGQERETPIEAVGAVVLYLQECRRAKIKPSESEIARVAVHAADTARAALAAREEPSGCTPCTDCGVDYAANCGAWRVEDELWQQVVGTDATVVLCPSCFAKRSAREEPGAKTHEYEMPESVIVARVAKAITDHRFSGGGTLGVGGPHALEIAKAAIAAFCGAREDTERPRSMGQVIEDAKRIEGERIDAFGEDTERPDEGVRELLKNPGRDLIFAMWGMGYDLRDAEGKRPLTWGDEIREVLRRFEIVTRDTEQEHGPTSPAGAQAAELDDLHERGWTGCGEQEHEG